MNLRDESYAQENCLKGARPNINLSQFLSSVGSCQIFLKLIATKVSNLKVVQLFKEAWQIIIFSLFALIGLFLKKLVPKFVSQSRVSLSREPKWKLLDPPGVKERLLAEGKRRREKRKEKGREINEIPSDVECFSKCSAIGNRWIIKGPLLDAFNKRRKRMELHLACCEKSF